MGHKFDPRHAARLDDPARVEFQAPETVLGLLELHGDETVVDYGAGAGFATLPLAAALPRGRVLAVDMSAELLDTLRARLAGADAGADGLLERVDLVHTTDNHVPLPDGSADAIVAVNLWHEIYDEQPALDELCRLLAPDGRLAIIDWAKAERPVGPPAEYVLTLDEALAVVDGMDLVTDIVHAPATLFPYHYAIVARPRG
jgi:SAM-dependent methyltransferase